MLPIKNTSQRYGIISQLFHWSIAILFITNFYLVYRRDYIPETDPSNIEYILLHKALGVTVLFLGILFLLWRFYTVKPALPTEMTRIERILAPSVHHLLWIVILLMPITGILMSVFGGRPTGVFGLFTIPGLSVPSQTWGGFFHSFHQILSYIIMGIVALHVLAALRHHFWLRDNVLRGMLPIKLK
jgi:cytochrome b561